jgi:glycosyltransferase involved in cell wall biosynthesis
MNELPPLFVTVAIRSYHRLDSMLELVEACRRQTYPNFEILVIEQSGSEREAYRESLEALRVDSRVRIVESAPLGPPGARNQALELARGDVVLFMDDDDLPLGEDWIRFHADNYRDPDIVGVSGREVYSPDERCGYKHRDWARRRCLSYGFFGNPYVYCRLDERIDRVDWLHGGNASIRRACALLAGGWQSGMLDNEEHSFAFRLARVLEPKQRLVFDPRPMMLRRKDLTGGLDRRNRSARWFFSHQFVYYHRIIGCYRPVRLALFYPVYPLLIEAVTLRWIWVDSHRYATPLKKTVASVQLLIAAPIWYLRSCFELFKSLARSQP